MDRKRVIFYSLMMSLNRKLSWRYNAIVLFRVSAHYLMPLSDARNLNKGDVCGCGDMGLAWHG